MKFANGCFVRFTAFSALPADPVVSSRTRNAYSVFELRFFYLSILLGVGIPNSHASLRVLWRGTDRAVTLVRVS